MSHSFNVQIAVEIGLHAAIIYNHIQSQLVGNISPAFIKTAVDRYMSDEQFDQALKILEQANRIEISHRNGCIYLLEEVK